MVQKYNDVFSDPSLNPNPSQISKKIISKKIFVLLNHVKNVKPTEKPHPSYASDVGQRKALRNFLFLQYTSFKMSISQLKVAFPLTRD